MTTLAEGHGPGAAGAAVRRLDHQPHGHQRRDQRAEQARPASCPTAPASRRGHQGPRERVAAPVRSPRACPSGSADQVIAERLHQRHPVGRARRPTSAPRRSSTTPTRAATSTGPLIAAIGRVESNHGRYGGNALDANGVSRPGIYGIPLDGGNGTAEDHRHRRRPVRQRHAVRPRGRPDAVHPLDLVGRRRGRRRRRRAQPAGHRRRGARDRGLPLLRRRGPLHRPRASGPRSTATTTARTTSTSCCRSCEAYADGDFTSVPTSSAGTTTFTPDYGDSVFSSGTRGFHYPKAKGGKGGSGGPGGSGGARQHRRRQHRSAAPTGAAPASRQRPAAPAAATSGRRASRSSETVTGDRRADRPSTRHQPVVDTLGGAEATPSCAASSPRSPADSSAVINAWRVRPALDRHDATPQASRLIPTHARRAARAPWRRPARLDRCRRARAVHQPHEPEIARRRTSRVGSAALRSHLGQRAGQAGGRRPRRPSRSGSRRRRRGGSR